MQNDGRGWAGREGRTRKALRAEWGAFLDRRWDHFVTLTSRRDATGVEFERWLRQQFIRALAQHAQQSVSFFAVVEGNPWLQHVHLHALLAGTAQLEVDAIEAKWIHGDAKALRYDPGRGARYYVTKQLVSEESAHWLMSGRLPPLVNESFATMRAA
jgi:hypothetical protein